MSFNVLLRHPLAKVPRRGSAGAAGYDLSAVESAVIEAGEKAIIDTGISTQFPADCYARVAPRSGLAAKNGIDVLAGVVDSDYSGNIKVILVNHGQKAFEVNVGDRIAQLIFERIYVPELQVVESLEETERGAGGFGSTGV